MEEGYNKKSHASVPLTKSINYYSKLNTTILSIDICIVTTYYSHVNSHKDDYFEQIIEFTVQYCRKSSHAN
jgi:hypothetical protein